MVNKLAHFLFATGLSAMGLGSLAQAQQTEDELIQKWFFYDAARVDQSNFIDAQFGITSARAVLADRKADAVRAERLLARNAVSEQEYRLALKDHKVAAAAVDGAIIQAEIMKLKADISDLRWRWHQGETRDIHVLENLQFTLWERQCVALEIRARVAQEEVGYAAYMVDIIRHLRERDATTLEELSNVITEHALLENQYLSIKEMIQGCKNGPPFEAQFEPARSRKPLIP